MRPEGDAGQRCEGDHPERDGVGTGGDHGRTGGLKHANVLFRTVTMG